jgi:Sulfotransferase domain
MALKVIGAGWGRTGTESLKIALEQLGYNRCYHGFALFNDGARLQYWKELHEKGETDFEALFNGYEAAVDFPAAYYYRRLLQQYPDAKVILTVRDASQWYESAAHTIFKKPQPTKFKILKWIGKMSPKLNYIPQIYYHIQTFLFREAFNNQIENKEAMMALFNQWNEEVKKTVPPNQLLVYEVTQGWEPLCRFLNVAVPTNAFPKTNKKESFQKRIEKAIFSPTGTNV